MGKIRRCVTIVFVAITAIEGGTAPHPGGLTRWPPNPTRRHETPRFPPRSTRPLEAARQGDSSLLTELSELGPPVVPALAPYLDDPDQALRREAVILLKVVGGDETLPLLERALNDTSTDIQARAATTLYERTDVAPIAARPSMGEALRKSVRQGNPSAAALALARLLSRRGDREHAESSSMPSPPSRPCCWNPPRPRPEGHWPQPWPSPGSELQGPAKP